MRNSNHGTTYMRAGGDDGELRPWHYIYEGRRGRWGTATMALHKRVTPLLGILARLDVRGSPSLSHTKCLESRLAKVNYHTNLSTYSLYQ